MYDYLYLATYSDSTKETLLNDPSLNFTSKVNTDTGEVTATSTGVVRREAIQNGLKFIIHSSGRIEIKGSLHKFYNNVTKGIDANYDLFAYYDAISAIELLSSMYGVVTEDTTVHNLETGVNFNMGGRVSVEALRYFIAYKTKSFNRMKIVPPNTGTGLEVYFNDFGVKVYDKGVQFALSKEVLRFEIKYIRMQAFEGGLKLSDLIKPDVWHNLSDRLQNALQDIVFTDKFNEDDLTKPEQKLLTFCDNPKRWDECVGRRERYNKKMQFITLINSKGQLKYRDFFTDLFTETMGLMLSRKGDVFTEFKNSEKGRFYRLSIRSISPLSSFESLKVKYSFYFENNTERYCAITRLPLVYFDKRSKNMNPKTLMYLRENCFEIFELLRLEFMQVFNGYTSKEPDEYTYIAKQIRNSLSNCKTYRIKASRFYKDSQVSLFNLIEK